MQPLIYKLQYFQTPEGKVGSQSILEITKLA